MEHATQQEVAQDSRHVTSVCKRHEPVFCVLLHLCKSTCGRPHTRSHIQTSMMLLDPLAGYRKSAAQQYRQSAITWECLVQC